MGHDLSPSGVRKLSHSLPKAFVATHSKNREIAYISPSVGIIQIPGQQVFMWTRTFLQLLGRFSLNPTVYYERISAAVG